MQPTEMKGHKKNDNGSRIFLYIKKFFFKKKEQNRDRYDESKNVRILTIPKFYWPLQRGGTDGHSTLRTIK